METTILYRINIGVILGLILEKEMEATIMGLYRDNGK